MEENKELHPAPESLADSLVEEKQLAESTDSQLVSAEPEDQDGEEMEENEYPKDFSLCYQITEEDYYQFQLLMAKPQLSKNRKRSVQLGWVEIVFGVLYFVVGMVSGQAPTMMQILLSLLLVGMGTYGVLNYKYFFDKQMRKASDKQYKTNEYFQRKVSVDFYPNKCVELVTGKDGEVTPCANYWHGIQGVRSDDRFMIIMLETKRCMLIPKVQISDQLQTLEDYLERICENFEKPRTRE